MDLTTKEKKKEEKGRPAIYKQLAQKHQVTSIGALLPEDFA